MSPHVMHGFTMQDLHDLAREVVISNRHRLSTWDWASCIDTAWSGAVEALCSAESPPERNDLYYAAWDAVRKELRQQVHDRPVNEESGARAQRFWNQRITASSPEESVVERGAFHQIWGSLSDRDRQVLVCSALCDYDNTRTADMLGISKRALEGKLRRARTNFNQLWHEHETPRPMSPKAVRRPGAGFAARNKSQLATVGSA